VGWIVVGDGEWGCAFFWGAAAEKSEEEEKS
jgi:hypothetical protein